MLKLDTAHTQWSKLTSHSQGIERLITTEDFYFSSIISNTKLKTRNCKSIVKASRTLTGFSITQFEIKLVMAAVTWLVDELTTRVQEKDKIIKILTG